ncbi:MAG: cellulose synthase, partial [Bauldia sp.]|nr:cellulose synthase [Bauldia sp.]
MSVTKSPAATWIALALIAAAVYWFWPAADEAGGAYWTAVGGDPDVPWTSPDGWAEMGVDFDFTSTPEEQPLAQALPAPLADSAPAVDESALRFFARQGDAARLAAEIARLRALYPDWEPPADPLAAPVVVDAELDRMWELYSEGRYAEVRAAIAERRARDAGWTPPGTLIELLAIGESRDQLIAASESGQYETVIRIGAATPALRVCTELDVMWRIAEAFARTGRPDRATDAYAYLLQNCDDPAGRFATMQKALAELPEASLDQLWQFERTSAAGVPEFEDVRIAIARNAVARGGEDVAFVLSFEDRTRMEALARAGPGAADATLLGWYHYLRDEVTASEQWFRLAHQREPSAESAEGLTLSLIALGEAEEAEDIAFPWRETSGNMLGVYLAAVAELLALDPALELARNVLARIVDTTAEAEDATTARQLGWYAYGFDQIITAEAWFVTALRWDPTDEEAAYGIALSRQRLGDTTGLAAIIAEWGPRSTRIRLVGQPGSAAAQPPAAVAVPAPVAVAVA